MKERTGPEEEVKNHARVKETNISVGGQSSGGCNT